MVVHHVDISYPVSVNFRPLKDEENDKICGRSPLSESCTEWPTFSSHLHPLKDDTMTNIFISSPPSERWHNDQHFHHISTLWKMTQWPTFSSHLHPLKGDTMTNIFITSPPSERWHNDQHFHHISTLRIVHAHSAWVTFGFATREVESCYQHSDLHQLHNWVGMCGCVGGGGGGATDCKRQTDLNLIRPE